MVTVSTEEQAQVRAREVLSSYASGNRTFCNANLRGANFQGQDLSGAEFSGADFSGADIRSAKFTNAILEGANFSRAQGGLQRRYVALRLVLVSIGIALTGAFHGLIGVLVAFSFDADNTPAVITGVIYLLFIVAVLVAVGWQGFTNQALVSVLAASLISFMGITLLTDLGEGAGLGIAFVVAFASATTIICVVMLPTMFSFIDTDNSAVSFFTFSRFVLAILLVALLIAIFFSIVSSLSITTSVTGAFLSTAAMSLFSSHVAKQVLCENNKFATIRSWSMGLGTSGGTSFCGADLQGANFSHANLKNTRFAENTRFANLQKQPAKLTRVCWKQAKGLDFALFGQHILKDRRVRTLLTTPEKVRNRDFTDSNLRGADLTDVRLEKAIFKRAILSDAIFKKANLLEANFTEAQVVNTDFTEACLTGTILESWNTNNNTIFKGVDCKYIFLRANFDKKGDYERRPHDPDRKFNEGDFERIFGKVPNEVQVI